jgi:hypothetical protein
MFDEIEKIFHDYYFNIYIISLLFLRIIIGVENVCREFNLPQNS